MDNLAFYQQRLKLESSVFWRIDHEDAMVAIVYKVTMPDGKPLILKICSGVNDYLREVHFLNYFAGQLPVPRILEAVPPENDLHGAVLMECLPGNLLKSGEFVNGLAYEIGSLLARIHLNRAPGYGDLIQNELNPDPKVYFTFKFDEGLDECTKHLPDALIAQCRRYHEAHIDRLTSVDGPCIVHRDFRPGNLMVDGGKFQGIIDWAGARASFAEEDLCSLEHGEWPNNPVSKKAFLEGYASIRPIPHYQEIMPLLRLSKAIATIGFTVKRGTWEKSGARVYRYNRNFLDTFFLTSNSLA